MHRAILIILLFWSAAFGEIVDSIVAKVNDHSITYSEILQEGGMLNIENNVPPDTPVSKDLKEKILDLLIIRNILFIEAKAKEVTVDEELVSAKYEQYMKNVEVPAYLKKYEITPLEFRMIIKERLISDKMTTEFIKKKFKNAEISSEAKKKAVEEWYLTLKKRQQIILYTIP